MTEPIDAILDYWFGELDEHGFPIDDRHSLWFKPSAETDQFCKDSFGELVAAAREGELEQWQQSDEGLVALVLLLDQMTRNIYRNTPEAFSGDPRALALALRALEARRHPGLPAIHQVFLYLPLEHSEQIDIQEQCVELHRALEEAKGRDAIAGFTRYAIAHRDVIAQFGRFPHRNAILSRTSTAEELRYLETHGAF